MTSKKAYILSANGSGPTNGIVLFVGSAAEVAALDLAMSSAGPGGESLPTSLVTGNLQQVGLTDVVAVGSWVTPADSLYAPEVVVP